MKKQFTTDWMLISLLICALIMVLIDMASQNRQVQKNNNSFGVSYSR
ncbi:hypothetical protein [Pedobacter psychrodurus]|nr:hypothetical protein [Pedobacter psychrodurus]